MIRFNLADLTAITGVNYDHDGVVFTKTEIPTYCFFGIFFFGIRYFSVFGIPTSVSVLVF